MDSDGFYRMSIKSLIQPKNLDTIKNFLKIIDKDKKLGEYNDSKIEIYINSPDYKMTIGPFYVDKFKVKFQKLNRNTMEFYTFDN